MKITDEQIEQAKRHTRYAIRPPHHEHPDCIRIAVEWLSAQRRTLKPPRNADVIKQFIEEWAGRYVSQSDVEVAATLLGLEGRYPKYNIHKRRTLPRPSRLIEISEAGTMMNYCYQPWRTDNEYTWTEADPNEPSDRANPVFL